jgi:hypothetical protein
MLVYWYQIKLTRNQTLCIKHYLLNVFDTQDFPSLDAIQISKNLSNMGQIYEDIVVSFSSSVMND